MSKKPLYGSLSSNNDLLPSSVYHLEHFDIEWDVENLQVRVLSRSEPDKIQWASIPGESFFHASNGSTNYRESRGSYFIRHKLKERFNVQQLDNIKVTDSTVVFEGKLFNRNKKKSIDYSVSFTEANGRKLSFHAQTSSVDEGGRIYLTYQTNKEEQFFGFGEQFTHFNLKGLRVPIFVSEQGIGRGLQPATFLVDLVAGSGGRWYTSYAPVPYYITNKMRSIFLKTYAYSVFDLRKDDKVQVMVVDDKLSGTIICGKVPGDIIEEYTEFTGRMSVLPDWINNGAVLGLQGGSARVLDINQKMRAANSPVAAYWIQDWVGQRVTSFGKQLWWNWQLDTTHYSNWDAFSQELKNDGIRLMGYINPFLADVREREDYGRDLLKEAEELDILVKDAEGHILMVQITSFSAAMLDLSLPQARSWIVDVIREELMDNGFSGWMADFGEALPMESVLGNPVNNASHFHNNYPEIWSQVNAEAIGSDSSIVYFNRSGYSRSPGVNRLFWLGDQLVTWDRHDGIKSSVTGLLSGGISGYSLNHSDIGGYTAITNKPLNIVRSRELLWRWIELNAFTAVFRSHEGNQPEGNYQIYDDEETIEHFARFARIYKSLAPYRRALMEEAATTGMPVVRHPFIHYPEIEAFWEVSSEQFMLGPDIMYAPVLDPDTDEVNIYLPEGVWKRAYSSETIESTGGYSQVAAPIGRPAVFYKAGSPVSKFLKEEP